MADLGTFFQTAPTSSAPASNGSSNLSTFFQGSGTGNSTPEIGPSAPAVLKSSGIEPVTPQAPNHSTGGVFNNIGTAMSELAGKIGGAVKSVATKQTAIPANNSGIAPNTKPVGSTSPNISNEDIPFTQKAQDFIKNNIGTANGSIPDGVGAETEEGVPIQKGKTIIETAPNQPPIAQTHELFNSIFDQSGINPATFNATWEKELKTNPNLQSLESQLNDPKNAAAYHGNAENVSTNPSDLASERFSLLGSLWGNSGISSLPVNLQPFYKDYIGETPTSSPLATIFQGAKKDISTALDEVGGKLKGLVQPNQSQAFPVGENLTLAQTKTANETIVNQATDPLSSKAPMGLNEGLNIFNAAINHAVATKQGNTAAAGQPISSDLLKSALNAIENPILATAGGDFTPENTLAGKAPNELLNTLSRTKTPEEVSSILKSFNIPQDAIDDLAVPLSKANTVEDVKNVLTNTLSDTTGPKEAQVEQQPTLTGTNGNLPVPQDLQNIADEVKTKSALARINNTEVTPVEPVATVANNAGVDRTIGKPTDFNSAKDYWNSLKPIEKDQIRSIDPNKNEKQLYESVYKNANKSSIVTLYHGTNQTFDNFDLKGSVKNTSAKSADQAVFFTDHPGEAKQYADMANTRISSNEKLLQSETKRLQGALDKAQSLGNWDKYESLTNELEELENKLLHNDKPVSNIMKRDIDTKNFKIVEMGDRTNFDKDLVNEINLAKKEGYAGVHFRNISDAPKMDSDIGPTNHYAVFDTDKILESSIDKNIHPDIQKLPISDIQKNAIQAVREGDTTPETMKVINTIDPKILDDAEKTRNNEIDGESNTNIQQRGTDNENGSGNTNGSVLPISGRDRLEAERKLADWGTAGTDATKLVTAEGKRLLSGEQIEITQNTHNVFRALGYSDEFSDTFRDLFNQGGMKNLSFNPVIDAGGGKKIEVYAAFQKENDAGERVDTLQINNAEKNHQLFVSGDVLRHEISGHSWYSKLTRDDKISLFDSVNSDRQTVINAWKKSGGPHQPYWDMTVIHMADLIKSKGVDHFMAFEILKDAGVEDKEMDLEEFVNTTLDLGKNFDAVNKELTRLGYTTLRSGPQNTVAFDEHVARIAEQAKEISASNPIVQKYIDRVKDSTLSFKLPDESRTLTPSSMAAVKEQFNGFKDLSTKILEKLKGRDTVSKQFIEDLTNSGEVKQSERNIIRDALKTQGEVVNVKEFADTVKAELLPLKIVSSKGGEPRYEFVNLPEELRGRVANYEEHVFESPIETSAGNVHFGGDEGSKNYFGHTRIEDMAGTNGSFKEGQKELANYIPGDTRRVLEVQSDLYQKGRLEQEEKNDLVNEIIEGDIQDFSQLKQYNNPSAHFRMVREEIKQASLAGKTKLQFPTGETAMKIEGLGQSTNNWLTSEGRGEQLRPSDLKVGRIIQDGGNYLKDWVITDILGDGKFKAVPKSSLGIHSLEYTLKNLDDTGKTHLERMKESFDISGKVDTNNPIYKFYEKDLGRYLKNNYDAKTITDDKGISWNEIPVDPEDAHKPVLASIKSTPEELQDLLKSAEDKARDSRQQDRLTELDKVVAQSPGHDSFVLNLHSNQKLGELLPQLNKDVQDNGYSSLTDYYVKNKITSNVEKGIVPQRNPVKTTAKAKAVEAKREAEIDTKDKLEAYKYIKDEMRDRINQHPGKVLQKYQSLKEGDFEDFKNPDLAKTPSERKEIIERNNKVVQAAERAMENDPRLRGMHDNPDVIREQIADYRDLKQQLANVTAEEKQLKTDIAKGKEDARLKQIAEIKAKAKEFKFTVPELDNTRSVDMLDIISQNELLKNHPAKPFLRYVNNRTGLLPKIDTELPGVYGSRMNALLAKNGLDTVADAQKLVDNYRAHSELLTEMYNERFDPLELAQANSVHKTPFAEAEKERMENLGSDGKPLSTIIDQDSKIKIGNDVMKKVGAHDYLRTPDRVLTKIGLGDEAKLIAKQYDKYLKELPKNIAKIEAWSKRVPGKDSSRKIFDYLDGKLVDDNGFANPDVLTAEEKRVGDEIKSWLNDWAFRLDLKPHEQISNYITHIFDNDLKNKEFDVDLAKIIDKKVAGEVYNPFLQERLGALGYRRDAWSALDAYVKRATRKVNMDVALSKVKVAAEKLDISSYNYVKSYVDRINLRPTATDTLIDNTIKQIIGYRFGARPLSRITQTARKWAFRGTLGLNASSALRNLVQGANTFAMLGTKYTSIGYTKLLSKENQAELDRENVLTGTGQIQDRTLSSTKKFWNGVDKGMFKMFQMAENINRGSAYFGYKAKYYAENSKMMKATVDGKDQPVRVFKEGASEEQAISEAKAFTKNTQFSFGAVDTPVFLQSDLAKTLLQFQSFNTKQAEFLAGMMKDKNYMGLLRFAFASVAFLLTVGTLFGMKWHDFIPFYSAISGSYTPPPLISAPLGLLNAALAANNQYGSPMTTQDRINTAVSAVTPLIPFGTQGKKTISGIQAIQNGNATTLAEKAKALFMGSTVLPDSATTKKLQTSLKTYQTKTSAFDPSVVAEVQPIFDQAKAAGFGTPAADALVQNLTDAQYKVYKALKVQDQYQAAVDLQGQVTPIVQQANALGFGTPAANKLVNDSFPNTTEGNVKYDAYLKVKTAMYGANPSSTPNNSVTTTDINKVSDSEVTYDQKSFINHIYQVANALGTDPVTTFNDIFSGNSSYRIAGVENGQVIVVRAPQKTTDAIKASQGGASAEYKLDHTIPLEIGGNNGKDNLLLLLTGDKNTPGTWAGNTATEDLLGGALADGKITGEQAREYIIRYKAGVGEKLSISLMNEYKNKYNSQPMTANQVKQSVDGN